MKKTKKLTMLLLLTVLLTGIFGATAFAGSSTVATIGNKKYTSLESALKKVKNGQTIVLKKNLTYKKEIKIKRKVKFTLNLNKKTITFAKSGDGALCVNKGTVTVKNGKITNKNAANNGRTFDVARGAKLTVSSGTYTGMLTNEGTTTIRNGTFTTPGYFTIINWGTMSITGGTFRQTHKFNHDDAEAGNGAIIANDAEGKGSKKLTISGGKFTSNSLIVASNAGTVTVNKGTFTSKNAGNLYLCGDTKATVKGGSWKVKEDWGCAYVHDEASLNIKDGTFNTEWSLLETYDDSSSIKVSGGKFTTSSENVAMAISFGGKITLKGGTFTGKKTWGYWINPENENAKVIIDGAKISAKVLKKTGEL